MVAGTLRAGRTNRNEAQQEGGAADLPAWARLTERSPKKQNKEGRGLALKADAYILPT
jgi:hypothetical protein